MSTPENSTPPAGYLRDAQGRLVPETMVKPIDKLRDQTIAAIVAKAQSLSAAIAEFKAQTFADIEAFVTTSAEEYGAALGGRKGNVSLVSFDGRYKVVRQIQEHLAFDERLQVAKSLVDECIQAWSEGSSPEIQALINDAFQVDQVGRVNTGRVLALKRLDIKDPQWLRAMQAIADSIRVAGSKPYVRVYERVGSTDQYVPIPLDIAAV